MSSFPARHPLRLGLVQFKPRKAKVLENLERIRERIVSLAPDHDLLVFPETALSGYFVEGGVSEAARSASEVGSGLGTPGDDAPDVVVGFYERWRRRLYNSVGYFTPDEGRYVPLHVHRKMFLPTYGIFDEGRFVEAGRELRAFDTRFGRMGVLICEEVWHSLAPTILALGGAELLAVVSASPARDFTIRHGGRPGNLHRWERLARSAAQEHGIFVAVSQLVGSEGGKLFPGGSMVVSPEGEILGEAALLEEDTLTSCLDGRSIDRARVESPLLSDLERMLPHLTRALQGAEAPTGGDSALGGERELSGPRPGPAADDPSVLELDLDLVQRSLVEFIREEVRGRRGFEKVVIGVSGGVDSAVSTYLAAEALGPENVHAFRLPHEASSPESLEHAQLVIDETEVQSRTIEITEPIETYVRGFEPDITDHRKGNLMARLRAVILFDQSARLHALPLGTGNKSERLLGYFTWHADDSPPINPLGDLFKSQVWLLARHLGVPTEIVDKPATADLVKGVTDEDEIGIGYHQADPILYWLVKGYQPAELVRYGFDPREVELVWERLNSTHWKRELPTVAVLSSSAIGEFYLRPVDY